MPRKPMLLQEDDFDGSHLGWKKYHRRIMVIFSSIEMGSPQKAIDLFITSHSSTSSSAWCSIIISWNAKFGDFEG